MKIAILMTCFNRKAMTVNCVQKLFNQVGDYDFDIYICDDASNDGTYETIIRKFPSVYIFQSTGNLYWCKGMYEVMKKASEKPYDYYLMVNDDVDFNDNMLSIMFKSYVQMGGHCGIVGTVHSKSTNKLSYGGKIIVPFSLLGYKFGLRTYKTVQSINAKKLQQCDVANWNCFLIDSEIFHSIGFIDKHFAHSAGDYDYSLRMRKIDYKIYITYDIVGYCDRNSIVNTYRDHNTPRKKRIKQLFSPKGIPFSTNFRFTWRYNRIICIPILMWRYFQFLKCILLKKDI